MFVKKRPVSPERSPFGGILEDVEEFKSPVVHNMNLHTTKVLTKSKGFSLRRKLLTNHQNDMSQRKLSSNHGFGRWLSVDSFNEISIFQYIYIYIT